ncbi:MAG: hypothetical protein ACI9E4_000096 [Pseudohongiellaceae bacterium]|jgi:hypothetical protein
MKALINRKTLVLGASVLALTAISIILGGGIIRKTQLDTNSQILALATIKTVLKARDTMLLDFLISKDVLAPYQQ